jgi:hypothetical protein
MLEKKILSQKNSIFWTLRASEKSQLSMMRQIRFFFAFVMRHTDSLMPIEPNKWAKIGNQTKSKKKEILIKNL